MAVRQLDFTTWEKEPAALLGRKESLDAQLEVGWRPNRLILMNYWRFGYEVFHFTQGRLVLRGANTTGKSTVLVSAVTFALDMEKRRERLDTFGGQGRGMAYYLLGDPDATPESDFYHEERTGYVALEFVSGGRCLTVGVGLYSSRNRPDRGVDAWGFLITDGSRIGHDVELHDDRRIPFTARELTEVLGGRGRVETRIADYQELVNRHLFGFDSAQAYEFLLSLLLQLRSPKLNKDTKPSTICDMLTESLPPLPNELLDQVTQIINDIDMCLETVESMAAYVRAVGDIDEKQAFYFNQLAQRAAVLYLQANEERVKAESGLQEAKAELAHFRAEYERVSAERERNARETREAKAEIEVLEQHEAFREQDQLDALHRDLGGARHARERAENALAAAEERLERLVMRQKRLRTEWADLHAQAAARVEKAGDAAKEAVWPVGEGQIQPVAGRIRELRIENGKVDASLLPLAALREAAEQRRAALGRVLEALARVEQTQGQYASAKERVAQEEEALTAADGEAAAAAESLEQSRDRGQEALVAWLDTCKVFEKDEELFERVQREVGRHSSGAGDVGKALAPLIAEARSQERPIQAEERRLSVERERAKEKRQDLVDELKRWQDQEDPEPPRREDQVRARAVLRERGIWAAPLYLACETDSLDQREAAALEQSLEAAGLLDALVVDGERVDEAEACLREEGLGDTWLRPAPVGSEAAWAATATPDSPAVAAPESPAAAAAVPPASKTPALSSVMKPAARDGHHLDVERALAGIRWFADPGDLVAAHRWGGFDQSAGQDGAAVAPGAWRLGPLFGTVAVKTETAVRYLGELNRRRFKEAEIKRLEGEISRIDEALWELENDIDAARARIERLRQEVEQVRDLPAWREINEAALKLEQARSWVGKRRAALETATEEADKVYRALMASRASYEETLAAAPEARGRNADGVRKLDQKTQEAVAVCERLASDINQLAKVDERLEENVADRSEATRRVESDKASLQAETARVQELASKERTVRERLASLDVDIEALTHRVGEVKGRIGELADERETLVQSYGSLEADMAHAGKRVERQEQEARTTREVEGERKISLAKRLQFYPTLAPVLTLFESGEETDPPGPVRAARELLKFRRSDEGHLLDLVERGEREAFADLGKAFADHRSLLVEYSPELEKGLVTFRNRGERVNPYHLRETLAGELLLNKRVLQEKESELYEEVILRDVAREIRERIALAHDWCRDVNALLATKQLSNGEVLSISWRPRPPDRTTGVDARRAVELLSRDVDTLTDDEVAELVDHFRRRVSDVRDRYRRQSLEKTFAHALAEILDYRSWFRFSLYSKVPSEERRELTDIRFAARSGAEKSLAMFIPILTAVHAHYNAARPDAPRLVGMDEAFAGVDEQNVGEMFRFLVELDFSWIMTSEKLWGVGGALPGCSTYELVKGDGGVIAPIWFVWDGSELLDVLQPPDGENGRPNGSSGKRAESGNGGE